MSYWKRQYTERPAGKPLFRPEPKSADRPHPPDPPDPCEPVENFVDRDRLGLALDHHHVDRSGSANPPRPGERGRPVGPTNRPAHQSRKGLLARVGADQAGSAAVLRQRRPRSAAPSSRSRHGDEALSQRDPRQVLLHEAHAFTPAGMDRDLRDPPWVGEPHRLPHGPGSRLAALAGEPRLHRPQSVVRPLRRRRSARLPPFRSRSRRRGGVRPGAGGRARGARRAPLAGHDPAGEDQRLEGPASLCPDRPRAGAEAGVDLRQAPGQGAGCAASRSHHRRVPDRRPPTEQLR